MLKMYNTTGCTIVCGVDAMNSVLSLLLIQIATIKFFGDFYLRWKTLRKLIQAVSSVITLQECYHLRGSKVSTY